VPVGQAAPAPTLSLMISTVLTISPVVGSQGPGSLQDQMQSLHGSVRDTQGAPPSSGKVDGMHGMVLIPSGVLCDEKHEEKKERKKVQGQKKKI